MVIEYNKKIKVVSPKPYSHGGKPKPKPILGKPNPNPQQVHLHWKDDPTQEEIPNRILALLTFIPFLQYFNQRFQDASVQEAEGLAMNESKLVKMPLHGSQRV